MALHIGATLHKPKLPPPYDARYDFNGDTVINVLDILLFKPFVNKSCTNPS